MADGIERDEAWAALFDSSTGSGRLAEIAEQYPEFAAAIERHPNCYEGLREWLQEYSEDHSGPALSAPEADEPYRAASAGVERGSGWPDAAASDGEAEFMGPPAGPPAVAPDEDAAAGTSAGAPPAKPRPRKKVVVVASVIAGLLVVGAGAASAAVITIQRSASGGAGSASGSSAKAEPAPDATRTLAGPPIYVGDELDWFLPSDDDLQKLVPGATDVVTNPVYYTIGEAEVESDPRECLIWVVEGSDKVVGARVISWRSASGDAPGGSYRVWQFPTADAAAEEYAKHADTIATCDNYTIGPGEERQSSVAMTLMAGEPSSRAFVVRSVQTGMYSGDRIYAVAVEGNVMLIVSCGPGVSADRILQELQTQASSARNKLTTEVGYR